MFVRFTQLSQNQPNGTFLPDMKISQPEKGFACPCFLPALTPTHKAQLGFRQLLSFMFAHTGYNPPCTPPSYTLCLNTTATYGCTTCSIAASTRISSDLPWGKRCWGAAIRKASQFHAWMHPAVTRSHGHPTSSLQPVAMIVLLINAIWIWVWNTPCQEVKHIHYTGRDVAISLRRNLRLPLKAVYW